MRIAHIVSTYPPYFGGMGNVVFETANELEKRGHQVQVFTPQYGEPPAEEIAHVRRMAPKFHYGNAAHIPQIKKELDSFDIVHLHYPFFGTAKLISKWKEKNPSKAFVITYHMDVRSPGWKGMIFKYYNRFWMPKILRSADALVASSLDFVEHSDAAPIYAEDPDKWTGIPFGVDTERFTKREKSKELVAKHNLNPERPTVLFVGGMDQAHYFKGVPVLIHALGLLRAGGLPIQAVFVGDGNLRSDFEKQAEVYGLGADAHFVGYSSDKELPEYYNLADLLVLPSTTSGEAFGMVLLEAMSSGVPVIASDLPGVRTVAEAGGQTIPPKAPKALAQAIGGFFDPQTDRVEWGARARAAVEQQYTWPGVTEQLERLYTQLVAS